MTQNRIQFKQHMTVDQNIKDLHPRLQPQGAIKNLIFDLGHVFIRIDTTRLTVFRAFSQLAAKYGKRISAAQVGSIFNAADTDHKIVAFHRGQMSMSEFRKYIKEKLNLVDVTDGEFDEAWTASILADPVEVKQRLAYMNELGKQGYKIYLLSNNNEIHRIHSKQHYAGDYWNHYFLKQYYSNETGLYKPEAAAFLQILKDNHLHPEETVFFDDVLKYVIAAWELGIPARQFTVNRPISDIQLVINSISQTKERGIEMNRLNTLGLFAINKFKNQLQKNHHELQTENTPYLSESLKL